MFHNLRDYDAHNIKQELGKLDSWIYINVILCRLAKYMSFSLDKKLVFIDGFQFWKPSLDSLVKSLNESDFKHLRQEFDREALELIKQRRFYPY